MRDFNREWHLANLSPIATSAPITDAGGVYSTFLVWLASTLSSTSYNIITL
jgi:hypothetical protein